jgi:hypothetical protein
MNLEGGQEVMTQQPEYGPSTMMPSLEAKLRQLVGELTPREESQLRAMDLDTGTDALSPSLRGKFQQCVAALTRDEAAQVSLLSRFVGGDTNDTVGYRIALYEGDPGKKGRPQSGIPADAAGSSAISGPLFWLALVVLGSGVQAYGHATPGY